MITIVDYGFGNVGSLVKMFAKIKAPTRIARTAAEIAEAQKLLLPGVGHFGAAMKVLNERGLRGALDAKVLGDKVPVLGICLGMQLLGRRSEEGDAEGLGWIDADVVRFRFDGFAEPPKIPDMGWRHLDLRRDSDLFPPADKPWRFYFVHSYHMVCRDPAQVVATADYGIPFTAVVQAGNVHGAQFHPEKSHRFGIQMLGAFARLDAAPEAAR